jgi:uncharacterized membrane protein
MKPVELLVATLDPQVQASDVLQHLIELNRSSVVELVTVMELARDKAGKVSAQSALDRLKAEGPLVVALADSSLGLFSGIAELLTGGQDGARPDQSGDVVLSGQHLEELAEELAPGTSAVLVVVEEEDVELVVREMQPLVLKVRRFVLEAQAPVVAGDEE